MEKIYQANYHLPILLAFTLISIGCTFNTVLNLPSIKVDKFLRNK